MVSEKYILKQFGLLSSDNKVEILFEALNLMKENNKRSTTDCIATAMSIPIFPKVVEIADLNGYIVTLAFKHGEEKMIDFNVFLNPKRKFEKILLEDYQKFQKMEVSDGTIIWPNIGITSKDFEGNAQFYPYDIDPGLLYEHSESVQLEEPSQQ